MAPIDGVLVIDKPAGPTSHDVVAVVRRALRAEKVGHTGTLDPLATGVLPLVIGRATRLASLLTSGDKDYLAHVRFGVSTATYDAEARVPDDRVPSGAPVPRDAGAIEQILSAFTGTYLQQPPPFSAKKIAGTPAYKLARRQQTVEVKPVEVTVRALALESYAGGLAELRITCSSGFYVRSLAHDLGQRLGCGAHLEALRRTRAGDFGLEAAHTLDDAVQAQAPISEWVIPMRQLLPRLPSVALSEAGIRRAGHGGALGPGDWLGGLPEFTVEKERIALRDAAGNLLGLAERRGGGLLHPVVVLV
jgi:tRNA pseudouridine55 synthase